MSNDLVYVPSKVVLKNDRDSVTDIQVLSKPCVFLVVEELKEKDLYKIYHQGKNWYVSKKDTFTVKQLGVKK